MKIKQHIQNGWPFFETDKELVIFSRSKNHLVTPTDRMVDREISPVCLPPAITVPRIHGWLTRNEHKKHVRNGWYQSKSMSGQNHQTMLFKKKWCQKIGVHLTSLVVEFLLNLHSAARIQHRKPPANREQQRGLPHRHHGLGPNRQVSLAASPFDGRVALSTYSNASFRITAAPWGNMSLLVLMGEKNMTLKKGLYICQSW